MSIRLANFDNQAWFLCQSALVFMFADVKHKICRPKTYVSRPQILCSPPAKNFFEVKTNKYNFDPTKL